MIYSNTAKDLNSLSKQLLILSQSTNTYSITEVTDINQPRKQLFTHTTVFSCFT